MNGRGFFDFGVIATRLSVARFFRRGLRLLDDDFAQFWMDFAGSVRASRLLVGLPTLT